MPHGNRVPVSTPEAPRGILRAAAGDVLSSAMSKPFAGAVPYLSGSHKEEPSVNPIQKQTEVLSIK